jgi:flagellar biosynthesis protein FliR
MPQLLVALIGAPLLIGLGLIVLYLALPEMLARWDAVLRNVLADPLGGLQ